MRFRYGDARTLLARMVSARDATLQHYKTIMTTIRAKAAARARDTSGEPPRPRWPGAGSGASFPDRYQAWLARMIDARAAELQALSRRIARQNAAITRFCAKHGIAQPTLGTVDGPLRT